MGTRICLRRTRFVPEISRLDLFASLYQTDSPITKPTLTKLDPTAKLPVLTNHADGCQERKVALGNLGKVVKINRNFTAQVIRVGTPLPALAVAQVVFISFRNFSWILGYFVSSREANIDVFQWFHLMK